MTTKWPMRWDLLLRYRFIEIIARWEGRLTTTHLRLAFGIGRQQASKDINTYNDTIAPGNLEYDRFLKGYKPSADFKPVLSEGTADEYLTMLARNEDLMRSLPMEFLRTPNMEVLQYPLRDTSHECLRAILYAAREQYRLETDYVSLTQPEPETRVLAPHTIVFSGSRWHVRAWCEKHSEYRDFVISRFRGEQHVIEDRTVHTAEQDRGWQTQVQIIIAADSRLNARQRQVIEHDYGMTNGTLTLETRAALAAYRLQQLRIDAKAEREDAKAQQIVLKNRAELEPWLF